MNNIVDFYSEREVIFIDSEEFSDFSSLPDYQFRNLVVIGGNGQGKRYAVRFWITLLFEKDEYIT